MKNRGPLSILMTIFALILFGCEPELVTKIKLPDEDPKLALSAFLIPGDTIHMVFLGGSQPNNKPSQNQWFVTNGMIEISDGSKKIQMQNLGNGMYGFNKDELKIESGKTYSVRAWSSGFPKEISAGCTIPDDFNPMTELVSFDSVRDVNDPDHLLYNIEIRFRDVQGTRDYYRVQAFSRVVEYINNVPADTLSWYMYSPNSQPHLITDEGKDGKWFNLKLTADLFNYEDMVFKLIDFEINVLRVDEAYYKFHYPFVVSGFYEDNPFGEPTIVYSNVKDGYGVLAGAVKKTLRINP